MTCLVGSINVVQVFSSSFMRTLIKAVLILSHLLFQYENKKLIEKGFREGICCKSEDGEQGGTVFQRELRKG